MKLRSREIGGKKDTAPWNRRLSSSAKRLQVQNRRPTQKARPRLHGRLGKLFRNPEQGRGWTPSPPASINQRNNDLPYRVNVEIPESSDNDGRGWDVVGEAELAPALPSRNHRLYPTSKIVWSYEVETESEIYRVSTMPTDFIGNSSLEGEDWTTAMKAAYKHYKSTQDAVDVAKANLRRGPVAPYPSDDRVASDDEDASDDKDASDAKNASDDGDSSDRRDAARRTLQKELYYALKTENKAREEFLRAWPSAFGSSGNFDTHIGWSRKLEKKAREVQKEPREYFYPM